MVSSTGTAAPTVSEPSGAPIPAPVAAPVATPVAVAEPSPPAATVPVSPDATSPAPTVTRSAAPAVADIPVADQAPPSRSTSETPDLTAPPEPVASATDSPPAQPAATAPAARGDAVATASGFTPDTQVPAAPRIAGLIGASEAAVPTAAGAGERVVIRATGDSWVQVRDAAGTALFTRVLREGDIYRVPSQAGLKLATGNAGALEVLVDGTPAPSLGNFGEVVRNVTLDPTLLASGTAAATR